jgi:DNA-binding transcriptional regulator LsrR (DeoR family)
MIEEIPEERYQLLADIAEMYYLNGLSQQEIADRVNLSRPSISRLLLEAREANIVEIKVNHPIPTVPSLEAELVSRFSLRAARVLERKTLTDEETLRQVGRLGATVLDGQIEDGMVLGLSWGTTVHAVVEALRPKRLPHVKVVQLIGGVGAPHRSIDGPEQVRRAGEMFGAQHYYLNAPMLVDNPDVATALREDHSIKEVLELARQSHVALIGIGSIIPEISTQFHSGYLSFEDLRQLDKLGVTGAMCISFFNVKGEHVPAPWCEECAISVSWEDLLSFNTSIGVATGRRKAPAILGAIRTGIIDILVTDDLTAESVLEISETM